VSGVAIIRHLLANSAGLIAVVPAARIMAGVLPLDTALPAISVTQISGQQYNNLAMASASYLVRQRVQVTILASAYPLVKSILALARAALPQTRGTVNGFASEAVIPDIEGPDLYDEQLLTHICSVDYMVTFHR
jgi:hypothetical protein